MSVGHKLCIHLQQQQACDDIYTNFAQLYCRLLSITNTCNSYSALTTLALVSFLLVHLVQQRLHLYEPLKVVHEQVDYLHLGRRTHSTDVRADRQ